MNSSDEGILDTVVKRAFSWAKKIGKIATYATLFLLLISPIFQLTMSSQGEVDVLSLRGISSIIGFGILAFIGFSAIGIVGILVRRFVFGIRSVDAD